MLFINCIINVAEPYVETALKCSKSLNIVNGLEGPFDHLFKLNKNAINSNRLEPFEPSDLFLYAVTDSGMNKRWGNSLSGDVKVLLETIFSWISIRVIMYDV
ncbi:Aldolase-type TIM barrel [Artemisia annua]|uniref:Aldolase-type TIM barrel n=1 Tax=Artemisia annua TaxID=35608 RepID=A0A2U1NTA0_ARTAN|nr:Aldolase-type TIM barrel [Artemisia annua]